MANNLIQIKRTSVAGRAANTSTLTNPGELALNMTDGILYSGNGSVVFEIGANTTNSRVTGNLTIKSIVANNSVGTAGYVLSSNGSGAYWSSVVGYVGSFGYSGSQGANSVYTVGNSTPSSPSPGDRWFNTDYAAEFVYTYDGDSYQWVEISATGFLGATGYTGSIGSLGYSGSIGYTGSFGPSTFPVNNPSTYYTVANTDNGGLISANGNVIINTGIFSAGQNFTVYNNTNANVTIVSNSVTMYWAGSLNTGNRTLAQRGLCTVICTGSNAYVINGNLVG